MTTALGAFGLRRGLCVQLLDATCGTLVIENIDIAISDGTLVVTPTHVPWTTGMIATAVGNNKIVRA